jgi:hypothetical protein
MPETNMDSGYFDRPGTKKLLWKILWITCAFSLILGLFVKQKSYFPIDDFYGFYALLGFLVCGVSIIISKGVGFILKRKENHYVVDE